MPEFNIQSASGESGLSPEEKAQRAVIGASSGATALETVDYGSIPKDKLELLLDRYDKVIKTGCLCFWIPLLPGVYVGLRAVSESELDDILSISVVEEQVRYLLFYSVVGVNRVFIKNPIILWKLVDFFYERVLYSYLLESQHKIQTIYTNLFNFVYAYVDLSDSKSLWSWYKLNTLNRDYSGLNDIEEYWVGLNSLLDHDSYFKFVQILGAVWGGKKLFDMKTRHDIGFSSLHNLNLSGKSNEDLAKEIEVEVSGEKDWHALAMEQWENQFKNKIINMKNKQEQTRKNLKIRRGIFAEVSWD